MQTWSHPASGLRKCGFCNRRRLLHYPKECLWVGCICHPCVFCGKEKPDHVPEDCPAKGNESQAGDIDVLFHQHIQFQRALVYQKICYICHMPELTDGHIEKCLSSLLVLVAEEWTPPHVCLDTVVGSGLPKYYQCGQARPLHYPGDCKWALYKSPPIPCLVCGDDDHILEQCPLPGTTVIGCETLCDLNSTHLTKLMDKAQCYICKGYHLPKGKFGDQHYTSKQCLHLLLAQGKVRWDRKESMLE